jgi:hypothetical protein
MSGSENSPQKCGEELTVVLTECSCTGFVLSPREQRSRFLYPLHRAVELSYKATSSATRRECPADPCVERECLPRSCAPASGPW